MRRIVRSRATFALPVPALLSLGLLCPGCAGDGGERRQQERGVHEEHAEEEEGERGPHGGRLLRDGDFGLEVVTLERGAPPEFRLYPLRGGKPVDPKTVTASITLARLGGRTDTIAFTPAGDYLRGDRVVEEPRSFDVTVEATVDGSTHTWAYEQIEGRVEIGAEALATSGIEVATAGPATIRTTLTLPGQIAPNRERVAHVLARLSGVLTEARRTLGDRVKAGEVLAVLDSRELADAKSEYIESIHRLEYAQSVFVREERLWQRKISPASDYLLAKHKLEEAEIEKQIAEQKLVALGVGRETLSMLAVEPGGAVADRQVRAPFRPRALTRYEIRAPIDGTVIERTLSLGQAVQPDTPLFTIADLSTVWAEAAVYEPDLLLVRSGLPAVVRARALGLEANGTVTYVGAFVGEQTRSATARVVLPNPAGRWRPGVFVSVEIVEEDVTVPVGVPLDAIQTVREMPAVFVRYGDVFEARPVELGRRDDRTVEVVRGLAPCEQYATRNSFVIKADLGKAGAEHDH
jgi:membrane fusion protein, heavy metal efflux system